MKDFFIFNFSKKAKLILDFSRIFNKFLDSTFLDILV